MPWPESFGDDKWPPHTTPKEVKEALKAVEARIEELRATREGCDRVEEVKDGLVRE